MVKLRKGTLVWAKTGKRLPFSKAVVVKKKGNYADIHVQGWGENVTGEIHKRHLKLRKR